MAVNPIDTLIAAQSPTVIAAFNATYVDPSFVAALGGARCSRCQAVAVDMTGHKQWHRTQALQTWVVATATLAHGNSLKLEG